MDTPPCGPDQLLVRHDAVGLCFSDTKVIHAGGTHPRLAGRDLSSQPVVLGHEVSLTVMQVGENLRDRFHLGERYIVQADIYYQGQGLAYGYALQGGLSQYNLIGPEILNGDEGCYLLPVRPETGYAPAALTEPWACVGASYDVVYRAGWLGGGAVLIVAGPAATAGAPLRLGEPFAGGQAPSVVVTVGVEGELADELAARATRDGFRLVQLPGTPSPQGEAAAILAAAGVEAFDDLVLLGADAATYAAYEPLVGRGAVINLVGGEALSERAPVDVGRLHYDFLSLTGTPGPVIAAAYAPVRTQLVPRGRAAFLGAAGPWGRCVQRALRAPDGPACSSPRTSRPSAWPSSSKYAALIDARAARSRSSSVPPTAHRRKRSMRAARATGGAGIRRYHVLAPSAAVIAGAVPLLAPGGVMNIFAGLARGTKAPIDLRRVVCDGVRFTGTSGSSIRDLRTMLDAAESGRLDPNLSVVAIAGMRAAKRGIEGVMQQTFPGKIVVYPQVLDFPLTPLAELASSLPSVYALLGPHASWTNEAEAQFLKEML